MPEEAPSEQVPDDADGENEASSAARDSASRQANEAGADEANDAGGEATGNPKSAG